MIRFYINGYLTLARAGSRLHAWAVMHPRWTKVLAVILIDLVIVVLGNTYAYADTGASPIAPFLPGGDIHDSAGIPLGNYTKLPIDRGDMFTWEKMLISSIVDPIWTGHLGAIAWMIWFLDWLLSFEWVGWIAQPFNGLATMLDHFLGQINWIPFALMISAFVGGLAIMGGRYARGGTELLVSAVCAVLAAGLLANPVASLTAAGGALDTAQSYGGQIAAAVVTDDSSNSSLNSDDVLSEAVTTQLVDIFIRIPAQTITFGHTLTGDCVGVFNDTMTSAPPVVSRDNTVRDRVGDCDETAKTYVQNPNFGSVVTALIISSGGLVLFLFAMAIAILFIVTVVFFLIAAIKTMFNVYLGILPISRYPLWRSLGDTFMGLVSIPLMTVVMAAYLKILVSILNATSGMGVVAQMFFIDMVVIVLIVLLWRVRRAAKKAGRTMAEQLSQLGMGKGGAPQRDRSHVISSMGQVVNTAANIRNMHLAGKFAKTPALQPSPGASVPSPGPVDGGHMHASTSRPSSRSSAPQKALTGAPAANAASKTAKTADMVFSAVNIAKAAAGGPGAVAAAAAVQVGGAVARKGASKALTASSGQTPAAAPAGPRRIVVDSSGVGHFDRSPAQPSVIYDISSLQPAPRSSRNEDVRKMLAGAKGD